jgi:exonuclease III/ribonuclease HI/predicted transposase YbfD/YdcC
MEDFFEVKVRGNIIEKVKQRSTENESASTAVNNEQIKWNKDVIYLNIGTSIRNVIVGINLMINQYKPELIILGEVRSFEEDEIEIKRSWLHLKYKCECNLWSKYENIDNNNTAKGGIIIIFKEELDLKVVTFNKGLLRISGINEIKILGAYAPSSATDREIRQEWWNQTFRICEKINEEDKELVLIGDLNVHIIPELDHNESCNCWLPEGWERLEQILADRWREENPNKRKNTYIHSRAQTRVDYALLSYNSYNKIKKIDYLEFDGRWCNDHCPIFLSFRKEEEEVILEEYKEEIFPCTNYIGMKKNMYQKSFSNLEDIEIKDSYSLNKASEEITSEIKIVSRNTFGEIFAIRNKMKKERIPKDIEKMFLNETRILKAIRSFKTARIKQTNSNAILKCQMNTTEFILPLIEDWSTQNTNNWIDLAYMKLCEIRKRKKKMLRKWRNKEINLSVLKIMREERESPKKFNHRLNAKKKFNQTEIWPKDGNGNKITDKNIIHEKVLSFWGDMFTSKVSEQDMQNTSWSNLSEINDNREIIKLSSKILSEKITVSEIKEVLKRSGKKKSPGPDGIPLEAIKEAPNVILERLCKIYTYCIENGIIPNNWRYSTLTLIHKNGNRSDLGNYRPIALLNSQYKIFTSIINTRLKKFLETHNILSQAQSGFREKRSTFDKTCMLVETIKYLKSQGKEVHLLFLDIHKAYDSVEHWALLGMLELWGFDQKFIDIIKDIYVNNRINIKTQFGRTDWKNISRGVRQGCPLSPTLFILFLDPLFWWLKRDSESIILENKFFSEIAFADDITLISDSINNLQIKTNMVVKFLKSFGMKLSFDTNKTKTVYMSNNDSSILTYQNELNIQIQIPKGKPDESYKHLGTWVNIDLNWTKQRTVLFNMFLQQIAHLRKRCFTVRQLVVGINKIIIPCLSFGTLFQTFPPRWEAKIERHIALLLSKKLKIQEASPLHFQQETSNGSFKLRSFRVEQDGKNLLHFLRVLLNNKDKSCIYLINKKIEEKEIKIENTNKVFTLCKNPIFRDFNGKIDDIKYFLFNKNLIDSLNKRNINSITQLVEDTLNWKIIPKKEIKGVTYNTLSKAKYQELIEEISENGETICDDIIDLVRGNTVDINEEYLQWDKNSLLVFTDGSTDEEGTGYSIFFGRNSKYNIKRALAWASNNTAEAWAVLTASRMIPINCNCTIFTDSEILIKKLQKTFTSSDVIIMTDTEIIKEIKYIQRQHIDNNTELNIKHIYGHLTDKNRNVISKTEKIRNLKEKFPENWEIIIEGNREADKLAGLGKLKRPRFKPMPSPFGEKYMLQDTDGRTINSGFKPKIQEILKIKARMTYFIKKEKFFEWKWYDNENLIKGSLSPIMKSWIYEDVPLQNFVFKIKSNKLYTLDKTEREDKICRLCREEKETVKHFVQCTPPVHIQRKWKKKAKAIINHFAVVAEKNIADKDIDYSFHSTKKQIPDWLSNSCYNLYPNQNLTYAYLGWMPISILDYLKSLKINKSNLQRCIQALYELAWKMMLLKWKYRCKLLYLK